MREEKTQVPFFKVGTTFELSGYPAKVTRITSGRDYVGNVSPLVEAQLLENGHTRTVMIDFAQVEMALK
jgi:hypothetical protein